MDFMEVLGYNPSQLVIEAPPSNDQETRGKEQLCKRAFINDIKGYGLVATKPIKAGTVIFSERFVFVYSPKEFPEGDMKAIEKTIKKKVNAKGPEFANKYFQLPSADKKGLDVYSAIWYKNSVPFRHQGERGVMVGPNVTWVNHSCFPNAHLALVVCQMRDPKSRSKNAPKMYYRAVLRACKDIPKGAEITRAYGHQTLPVISRQLYFDATFRFRCACPYCTKPIKEVEEFCHLYPQLQKVLNDPQIVSKQPALAFQAAHAILEGFMEFEITDLRVGVIWQKCAALAAHHSDLGRAMYFLQQAEKLFLKIEGPFGYLYRHTLNWQECPEILPGFGGTMRGLSTRTDWKIIAQNPTHANEMLFMLGQKPEKYIRLSRYRIRPTSDGAEGELEIMPVAKKKRTKRKGTKTGDHKQCIDPEKDFLDVTRELLQEEYNDEPEKFKPVKPIKPLNYDELKKQAITVGLAMAELDEWRGELGEKEHTLQAVDLLRKMDMNNVKISEF